MAILHVVLFRMKRGLKPAEINKFKDSIINMQGRVPGLRKIRANRPLTMTAHRAHGWNMGLVSTFETYEQLASYATHPVHVEVIKEKDRLCDDLLAYDIEVKDEVD